MVIKLINAKCQNETECNLIGLETADVKYTITTKYKQNEILNLYIQEYKSIDHVEIKNIISIPAPLTNELLLRYLEYLSNNKKVSKKYKRIKKNDPLLNEQCCICLSSYEYKQGVRKTQCNHIFHKKCVDKWYKYNKTCPICRNHEMFVEKSTSFCDNN